MKTRKDVYQLPSGDQTLAWYAKAVAEMKTRDSSDPTSWAYQGAIHGLSADPEKSVFWQPFLPLPTRVHHKKNIGTIVNTNLGSFYLGTECTWLTLSKLLHKLL